MKPQLLIACLFAFLAMFVVQTHAEEATPAKLTGTWWGTTNGEGGLGRAHQRWHWSVQRKANGSYTRETYWVDHVKKVYCMPFKAESGTWELKDGMLQYIIPSSGRSDPISVRLEDGKVRWEHKTILGGIGGGAVIDQCSEEPAKKYGPQLPDDYRLVSEAEFNERYAAEQAKRAAEQAAKDAMPTQGGFVLPGDEEAEPAETEKK